MRSPRLPSSTAQIDYRRGEKTLARWQRQSCMVF
jgi:hypothetical protein